MGKYHVGCGLAGIYAGVLNPKNQSEWKDKSECTEQAIVAVRDYMVDNCLGGLRCTKGTSGGYLWNLRDGRTLYLRVEIEDPNNPFDSEVRHYSLHVMNEEEHVEDAAFRAAHYMKCRNGSTFQYELTGTGIGTAVSVICPRCGERKDITSFDNW